MTNSSENDKPQTRRIVKTLVNVMVTIWRTSPRAIFIQAVGAILTASLPLATTYFAALTTTTLAEAYTGGDPRQLFAYVVITVILGVIMSFWGIVQAYFEQLMRYQLESSINDQMFMRLHGLDFWRYDDPATIDMFDRARRFASSFSYLFSRLTNIATNIVSLVVGLWIISSVGWWLGLLLVVAIIPSGIIQFRLSRLTSNYWRKNTNIRRRMWWIEYAISKPEDIAELRLYGVIKHLLAERAALRDKDQLQMIKYERSFMAKRFGGEVLQAVAEVAALVWVTLEIIAHRQPIGQFVLVQQMVSRVLSSVDSLISTYNSIDEEVANMVDYQRFMELPLADTKPSLPLSMDKSITVSNVKFHYPGSETLVLKGLSLDIKRGQHVAIVGENGAGKTTLVKLLTGLYQPTSGEILIDGRNLSEVNMADWHRQLAVLSQSFIRYDFATAYENVWYGDVSRELDRERLAVALKQAEADDFVKKLPKGGDSYVDKWMTDDTDDKGVDLSGGQWQRLALARNFYRDAPIVILDEPTSAVDAAAEARIFRHLFKQKDKTIIAISHRLSTVKKADVIYFMKDGRIVEQGACSELIAKCGEFYEMFKEQL
ncbi:ABC transporter ATP-binding protein [TM7 phylum sp. oral taxon 353]|nr:ABC transporter ATP-binding protein [TM7 phylum sp. oral taxon 353]